MFERDDETGFPALRVRRNEGDVAGSASVRSTMPWIDGCRIQFIGDNCLEFFSALYWVRAKGMFLGGL